MRVSVSENLESCYSLRSTSDDENPLWPCSPRNSAAGEPDASEPTRRGHRSPRAPDRPSRSGWTSHDARGLLNARLQSSASRRNRREGNFSSLQTLGNKRNRIGIPPAPLRSEDADATAATVAPRVGRGTLSRSL